MRKSGTREAEDGNEGMMNDLLFRFNDNAYEIDFF